jgi:hypothetical protein
LFCLSLIYFGNISQVGLKMDILLINTHTGDKELVTVATFDELKMLTEAYFQIIPSDQMFARNGKYLKPEEDPFTMGLKFGENLIVASSSIIMDPNYIIKEQEIKDALFIPHKCFYLIAEYQGMGFKILIDSGAQTSIITERLAKTVGLINCMDRRYTGKMTGVASSTDMTGVITNVILKLSDSIYVPANFRVIKNEHQNFLAIFGMDFLLSHKCKLDFIHREIEIDGQTIRVLNELQMEEMSEPFDINQKKIIIAAHEFVKSSGKMSIDCCKAIIENIIKNQDDPKFRRINPNCEKLLSLNEDYDKLINFLKIMDFKESVDRLLFDGQPNQLQQVLNELIKN